MRAVRSTADGIAVVDVPPPEGAGVRVHVQAAGICGSDLEMVRLGPLPVTLGHEFAGALDDGTPVAVRPSVPCGACDRCTARQPQQCRAALARAYGISADGGMAESVVVDASCITPIELPVTDAALVEPTAVALHALNRAGVCAGMNVGVVGAGTIGLLCAAVGRSLGCTVTIAARHDAQRRAAEALGVTVGLGRSHDVVVEAAGTATGFDDAVRACARGGIVALVSTTWEPVTVSFMAAQMREVTIVPAFLYGEAGGEPEFTTAARLLAAHPEWPGVLVTHRFPLAAAAEAFRVAGDRAHGAIKVVLEP